MSAPSPRPLFRFFALMLPLVLLVPGCATQHGSRESVVWASRGQFIKAVDREGPTANQHPVSLSDSRLRAELATLKVKLPGIAKPVPIFGVGELENLGTQIPAGLRQAGPDQDLVFAVIGEIPYLLGLAKKDVVTTGRVFYQDNRLNLILGLVREMIDKQLDSRLQPFTPGSRLQAAALPGAVTSTSPAVSFRANRPDWITMVVPEGGTETPEPQAEPQPMPQKAVPQAGTPPERMDQAPAPAPVRNGTVQPERSIEERLRILGELKAKGLITEEEYRAKKTEILKEL